MYAMTHSSMPSHLEQQQLLLAACIATHVKRSFAHQLDGTLLSYSMNIHTATAY
jgi:hypothetical protein